jgi:malonyl CoA-acyl carrier protein transacylase
MDRATKSISGAMAAIMPIDGKSAEELCEEASKYTQTVCSVANFNSNKQVTYFNLNMTVFSVS